MIDDSVGLLNILPFPPGLSGLGAKQGTGRISNVQHGTFNVQVRNGKRGNGNRENIQCPTRNIQCSSEEQGKKTSEFSFGVSSQIPVDQEV